MLKSQRLNPLNFSVNWFKYRLPNSSAVVCGASESIIKRLGNGFAIAPFLSPVDHIITIPFDFIPNQNELLPIPSVLPQDTPKSEYFKEIKAIQDNLDGKRGKTVAARVINEEIKIDVNATFDSLCQAYPAAFVFAFSTAQTGTWIGASPELLLKKEDLKVSSVALAGTRRVSTENYDKPWDIKNSDEQRMVVEFIKNCLDENCKDVKVEASITKNAGNIEHICTPLHAYMLDNSVDTLIELLSKLSPTPALCGDNRNQSLELISSYEKFDRELYGGFCGPLNINNATEFYVILRSAKCNINSVAIFAGGGITHLSIPEEEWKETEMKSKTIINHLKISEE